MQSECPNDAEVIKNLNNNIFTSESKKQQNKTNPKAVLSSHTTLPRERTVKIPHVLSNSENAKPAPPVEFK